MGRNGTCPTAMARRLSSGIFRVTRGATDETLARILIRGSATIAAMARRQRRAAAGSVLRRHALFAAHRLLPRRRQGDDQCALCHREQSSALPSTMTAKSSRSRFDDEALQGRHSFMTASTERVAAKAMVVCAAAIRPISTGCAKVLGPPPTISSIRGTPYDTGAVLRQLLDAGARPVGDPERCHMVAVDARGPKFDGGIVTRITAIPHGIVVDRDAKRFHDEGEDARKTHFARWGARIADCPDQIAYLILDAKALAALCRRRCRRSGRTRIAALATALGLDPAALETTIDEFQCRTDRATTPRTNAHRTNPAEIACCGRADLAAISRLSDAAGHNVHAFRRSGR